MTTRALHLALAPAVFVTLLIATSCSGTQLPPQAPAPSAISTAPSTEPDEPGEVEAPAEGTRSNPIPRDTLTKYDSDSVWSFSVGETNPDGWDIVRAENSFNDAPAEGYSYVIAPFYLELSEDLPDETTDAVGSLEIVYVSSAGNTSDWTSDCGVISDPFYSVGEMYPGANVRFNVCYAVVTADVAGGTWRVSSTVDRSASIFLAGAE